VDSEAVHSSLFISFITKTFEFQKKVQCNTLFSFEYQLVQLLHLRIMPSVTVFMGPFFRSPQ